VLVGVHQDTLNLTHFSAIRIVMVGSVVIDDIELIVETDDDEPVINPLLEKYAPIFHTHPREKYDMKEIQSLMNYSDLKKNWNDFVSNAPTTVEEITDLEDSKKHYMDMTNVNVNDLYETPHPDDFTEFNSEVYGRVKKDTNNFTHLQYYVFYPYQDWYTIGHEGDWQLVEVVLDRNDVLYSVVYYFNRWRVIYYDLDLITFVNDTHPVVLVAEGSHNNYARDDALVFSFNIPEHMRFWGELFWGLKKLDKLSMNGTIYKPYVLTLNPDERSYQLEEINSETPWINYEGRWGQKSFNPWWSGPVGPRYNENFQDWDYPDTIASAIKFPFMGTILYSPLDLSVYDFEGNMLDETDFFINTGSGEDPESIFTTGYENYTLFLTANDHGQFTLDLFYYDNITDSGIMLRYENISNTNLSEGFVNISYNSHYVLWFDYNGDGTFESLFLPDKNVTYNRNYVLPDSDDDSINDYLDNCPEIPNSGQEDIDGDGKGNVCENSVLLKEEAMLLLENYVPENKNEEKRIENAKRHLQESLNPELWTDSFTPITAHVFMDEFVSTKNFAWNVMYKSILTEADRLIVLYSLDPENSKANYFYELGNEQFGVGNYSRAIIYYKNAWKFLNKKT
jgi:hypothetical protein